MLTVTIFLFSFQRTTSKCKKTTKIQFWNRQFDFAKWKSLNPKCTFLKFHDFGIFRNQIELFGIFKNRNFAKCFSKFVKTKFWAFWILSFKILCSLFEILNTAIFYKISKFRFRLKFQNFVITLTKRARTQTCLAVSKPCLALSFVLSKFFFNFCIANLYKMKTLVQLFCKTKVALFSRKRNSNSFRKLPPPSRIEPIAPCVKCVIFSRVFYWQRNW